MAHATHLFYWIAFTEIVIEWVLGITIFIAAIAGESAFYSIGGVDGTFFTVVALVGVNFLIWVFLWLGHMFSWFEDSSKKGSQGEKTTAATGGPAALFGMGDYTRYFAKAFFAHVLGVIIQAILYNEVADTSARPDPADTQNFVHYMIGAIYQIAVVAMMTHCFLALHQDYWKHATWMFDMRKLAKLGSRSAKGTTSNGLFGHK